MALWLIERFSESFQNVLGILIPVQFGDNSKRSLNLGYNFQSQYLVPPGITTIFAAPFFTGFSRSSRMIHSQPDESRQLVYNALESTWENWGRNGRECLLRAVCEVASSPYSHNGLFGEIVDLVFTPQSDVDEEEDLHDARQAGLNHADCGKTFSDCPPGDGFLDSITHFLDHWPGWDFSYSPLFMWPIKEQIFATRKNCWRFLRPFVLVPGLCGQLVSKQRELVTGLFLRGNEWIRLLLDIMKEIGIEWSFKWFIA